ncbi:hypothetical protein WH5701_12348 [Synechococcus sp. WH 5701]|nr:hypothetical protein WH5701_12348 [Synechococcus sp. WH 5701]
MPKAVREALGLRQGDLLSWELAYLQGLERGLSEWSSPADENAFRDL